MTITRVPSSLVLGLALLGLAACSGGGGSDAPAAPPADAPPDAPSTAPAITRFSANRTALLAGDSLTLLAVFENGTGTVDQGVGAVTSGHPVALAPFTGKRTFTLTVTSAAGEQASATTTVSVGWGSGRHVQAASLLVSGKVLITGGFDGTALAAAQLFDASTGTSVATATPMTAGRYGHTSTLLPNGKVLLAGGSDGVGALATAELYDPIAGTFTATSAPMTVARHAHTATLVAGKVLLAGGADGSGTLASAEVYDPATDTFTATTGAMSVARQGHTATVLGKDRVLVTGGSDETGATLEGAELYLLENGSFLSTAGGLATARRDHTATRLADGSVLIAGGRDAAGAALASAELYAPATGTFAAATGSLGAARFGHTATLLHDGTVLLAGGTADGHSGLASTEVYAPGEGTFAAAPSQLGTARLGHAAVLLQTGRILAAGGDDGTSFSAAPEALDEANPPVFLIVGVTGEDGVKALQGSLTTSGYPNEMTNALGFAALALPDLAGYAGVAYATSLCPTCGTLPLVQAYLDAGGKLLISYNDIAYSWRDNPAPSFFSTYFGIDYGADHGSEGSLIGFDLLAGVTTSVSTDPYPDSLVLLAGSDAVGILQNQPPFTDWAGIRIARNGYKAIVMGFNLNFVTDPTTRDSIVQKSVDWLTTP